MAPRRWQGLSRASEEGGARLSAKYVYGACNGGVESSVLYLRRERRDLGFTHPTPVPTDIVRSCHSWCWVKPYCRVRVRAIFGFVGGSRYTVLTATQTCEQVPSRHRNGVGLVSAIGPQVSCHDHLISRPSAPNYRATITSFLGHRPPTIVPRSPHFLTVAVAAWVVELQWPALTKGSWNGSGSFYRLALRQKWKLLLSQALCMQLMQQLVFKSRPLAALSDCLIDRLMCWSSSSQIPTTIHSRGLYGSMW